jgi:Tfp pilus assembly protein FimT
MKINHLNNSVRHQRGQGMTEYIIIVALIAVAAIGVFRFYGQTARSQVAVAAQELAGQNSRDARLQSTASAASAEAQADQNKNMATFNQGNAR